MKKILLISYYYPPCNSIAANRPKSFANALAKDFDTKVITRSWKGNEKNWEDLLDSNNDSNNISSENLEEIYLPYQRFHRPSNKFKTLKDLFNGKLDQDLDVTQFESAIHDLYKTWKPDVILVSSPPLSLLTLVKKLYKIYNTPYIIDLRDYQNDQVLKLNPSNHTLDKYKFHLTNYHVKKIVNKALFISAINQEFLDHFNPIQKEGLFIHNGFEQNIFEKFCASEEIKSPTFNISLIGTLYPYQEYQLMLKGIKHFINNVDTNKIKLNFIGTRANARVSDDITQMFGDQAFVNITHRIPRMDALKTMEQSHILWHIASPSYRGVYSGKLYEYLGARRNILIAPNDYSAMESLLTNTKAGKICNTEEEVSSFLLEKYKEWSEQKAVKFYGDLEIINNYSREKQASILIRNIKKYFS